jgi:hypothetical protein
VLVFEIGGVRVGLEGVGPGRGGGGAGGGGVYKAHGLTGKKQEWGGKADEGAGGREAKGACCGERWSQPLSLQPQQQRHTGSMQAAVSNSHVQLVAE